MWIKEHNENDAEMIVDEKLENNEEDLVTAFLHNRRHGFRRTNPSFQAEPKSKEPQKNSSKTLQELFKNSSREKVPVRSNSTNHVPHRNNTNNSGFRENVTNNIHNSGSVKSVKRYCHYWNNSGNCTFRNCIFAHEKSPICNFDGKCHRKKCMYSHMKQTRPFLYNKQRISWPRTHPSPWTMAPPSQQTSSISSQTMPPPPPPRTTAPPPPPQTPYWSPPAPWAHLATNPWMVSRPGHMGMNTMY